jgi:hypothetical protein
MHLFKKLSLILAIFALCTTMLLFTYSLVPPELAPQIMRPASPCADLNTSYYMAQIEKDLAHWRKVGRIAAADLLNVSQRHPPKRITFAGGKFLPYTDLFAPIGTEEVIVCLFGVFFALV